LENSKKQQRNLPFCSRSKTHEQGKTYTIEITENGKILSGKQQVKFSDFGITPPRKMAGMVVTKDELDLSFSFQNN